ncbi:hypothetical protein DFAR_2800009 [Desulfarculales bacterium]
MPCLASGPARASPSSTRLKVNAVLEMMASRLGPKAQNVLANQTILSLPPASSGGMGREKSKAGRVFDQPPQADGLHCG